MKQASTQLLSTRGGIQQPLGVGLGLVLEINLQDSHPMCMNMKIHTLMVTINELVAFIT